MLKAWSSGALTGGGGNFKGGLMKGLGHWRAIALVLPLDYPMMCCLVPGTVSTDNELGPPELGAKTNLFSS